MQTAPLASAPLDLLVSGATILTADPTRPCLTHAFLGIRDGRIAWLDTVAPPQGASATLEADGRLVTPGLVNVHTHSVLTMVRGVAADLGFAPSYTPGIPKASDLTPEQARAFARLGALEALLAGSTVIGDHFTHADVTTAAIAELGLRVAASWRILDVDFDRVASSGEWVHDVDAGMHLLDQGLQLVDAWSRHSRVTVQLAAHAADTCSDTLLHAVAEASRTRGLRVNTHLGQSRAEVERVQARRGRTSAQVFAEAGLLNDQLLAGHCIYVDEDDARRMARAGVHVVHIPKCNAASGRLAPTPMLRRAGLNIALATDTQHGDMIEVMRWALATARIQEGKVDEQWQPEHVFHMATQGGADAMGMGEDIGSLAVGKAADLVILDARRPHLVPLTRPVGTLVHTGQGRDVDTVIVAGEIVVRGGRPVHADLEAVCAEATEAARALWAAA
ncbi:MULTISPECIES: amidohydrolase family protein [unclassified Achromobacter]|uniref:amidohydrolase family protein n=1 Tax=unclassified Achromobacter TaxID=2626865 RepID=UPI000B51821B|nr:MULTISPECIES: amidohydrolase family protein [unclassified Achromobacter]OWT75687.1 hydrolase [Achromobacter sp. HZ28]OWT76348.1 hydrolase [Achromobacter sp. HZ34]